MDINRRAGIKALKAKHIVNSVIDHKTAYYALISQKRKKVSRITCFLDASLQIWAVQNLLFLIMAYSALYAPRLINTTATLQGFLTSRLVGFPVKNYGFLDTKTKNKSMDNIKAICSVTFLAKFHKCKIKNKNLFHYIVTSHKSWSNKVWRHYADLKWGTKYLSLEHTELDVVTNKFSSAINQGEKKNNKLRHTAHTTLHFL